MNDTWIEAWDGARAMMMMVLLLLLVRDMIEGNTGWRLRSSQRLLSGIGHVCSRGGAVVGDLASGHVAW